MTPHYHVVNIMPKTNGCFSILTIHALIPIIYQENIIRLDDGSKQNRVSASAKIQKQT
jgi:hypothetical protein